jgi:hypothetical protein
VSVKWNGERAWGRNRKVTLTPSDLEELGAQEGTLAVLAKPLGISGQRLSAIINKNLTNRKAFDKGRLKTTNGKRSSKI